MNHYTEVLHSLTANSVILTPNRRLALALQNMYQHHMLVDGGTCWETPVILPVTTWLETCWSMFTAQSFIELPFILNASQEQLLWEKILSESQYQQDLLQVSETARLVKSARGILKQWCVTTNHPLFNSAEDYAALREWINTFESICQQNNWIDQACLPDLVCEQIQCGKIKTPDKIYCAGFTETSPQLSALLTAAKDHGSEINMIVADQTAQILQRTSALNNDEEIRLCASWAKHQHDQHPAQMTGCVFPKLERQRDRVMQIFKEVFGDEQYFNISAGKPLSHYPVIHAALECLHLYKNEIDNESLFFLLSTPFISGGESERIKRSHFDSRLRAKNATNIDINTQLVKNEDTKILNLARSCPKLANAIRQFKALLEEQHVSSTYAHWAHVFNQVLTALGWPGERILNSEEYQVVEEWLALLQEMTTLDLTSPPVNFFEAVQTLRAMAAAKPFQPKSPAANVQILGVLEAAGLCFDQLWIAGMDDISWPSQPKPNPFIPKQMQRELKMPHASAERELQYCKSITRQFECSAHNVIFSYARSQDDHLAEPSPLIQHITETLSIECAPANSEKIYLQKSLEKLLDQQAPAQMENEQATGGVSIITNQALCPFKAFAESRLGARDLESTLPGLRSKERGTIIHYILERCWKELVHQEKLIAMNDHELHVLLEAIIDEALRKHAHPQQSQFNYLALEKQRLLRLMRDWLEVEKQRGAFTVVNSETSADIQLGKLAINVRIDRIDQLADGNKLIIDYKTGSNVSRSGWFSERPEAPQLPLYTQIDSANTAGIAYAHVAAGKLGFVGISQYELEIKGITPSTELNSAEKKSWETLADEWRTNLNKLADDFYDGYAAVDPKDDGKPCQYCNLKPLCRIYEQNGYLEDE